MYANWHFMVTKTSVFTMKSHSWVTWERLGIHLAGLIGGK